MELPIQLVDGRVLRYRLILHANGAHVSAREESPSHLPAFCPERHINYDGTFCLYYPAAEQLIVTDTASAVAWLETLYKFLKLQERAHVKRKWPDANAWAHGGAAHHQLRAIKAAAALNVDLSAAVEEGKIAIARKTSQGRSILEVWVRGAHLYSVWESHKRVVNQKRRCFCQLSSSRLPKRIRRCSDHSKQASELALAIRDWNDEEKRYWNSMRDKSCCGTCDHCPLAIGPLSPPDCAYI